MSFKVGDIVRYCGNEFLDPWRRYRDRSLAQKVIEVSRNGAAIKVERSGNIFIVADVFELYSVDLENK